MAGVPVYKGETQETMVTRLVAVQEYKVRKVLKERLTDTFFGDDEDQSQNKDYLMT